MTNKEFQKKQFELSVMAGVNQRYHQSRAHRWTMADRWFKIAVGVLSVAGLCLSVATMRENPSQFLNITGLICSIGAAIVAVVLNVFAYGEWASIHADLFRRWTDLREEIDDLLFDVNSDSISDDLASRLRRCEAKVHRICGSEPGCNKKLLDTCYNEEMQSRTPKANIATCAA